MAKRPTSSPKSSDPSADALRGSRADDPAELVSTSTASGDESLLLPGGTVDPDALRRAVEAAQAAGSGGDDEETDDVLPRITFSLRRDLAKRLDKYLTDRITFMSRNQLQKLIENGGVTVNGRAPKASTVLRAGDTVEVLVPPPPSAHAQPEDIPLDILYEDEHILVLNKTPDIIVHPARTHNKGTLINALAYHFKHRSPSGGGLSGVGKEFARPGVVHRLDRQTSGVIVFAKQDEAHWKLGHQFEHRRVDKRYLAIVEGIIETDADVIDLPLGPHPSREKGYREKHVVRHDEQGKNAVTIVRVRERYWKGDKETERRRDEVKKGTAPGWVQDPASHSVSSTLRNSVSSGYTLVELELKTGRTHQIRVHLSHLGWPIVGDDMYGGKDFVDADGRGVMGRVALHACILGFRHPITEEPMQFTAPLRGDMAELLGILRQTHRVERPATPGVTVDLAAAIDTRL
ncbi:MAG: RluA family pseudouridine synthase [Phycisphaerales bacterium]|nr:RluA family pseudouridine synthase [Phycisphaerales bacterium]